MFGFAIIRTVRARQFRLVSAALTIPSVYSFFPTVSQIPAHPFSQFCGCSASLHGFTNFPCRFCSSVLLIFRRKHTVCGFPNFRTQNVSFSFSNFLNGTPYTEPCRFPQCRRVPEFPHNPIFLLKIGTCGLRLVLPIEQQNIRPTSGGYFVNDNGMTV